MAANNTHWEYLFVHVGHARGFHESTWRPYKVNGKELPKWEKGPHWQDYFHELGNQGWEFITFEETFIEDTLIGGKLAIFKRRRETEPPVRRLSQETQELPRKPPFISEP